MGNALGLHSASEGVRSGDYAKIKSGKFRGVEGHIKRDGRSEYFDVFVSKPDPRMTGLGMVININKSNLKKLER